MKNVTRLVGMLVVALIMSFAFSGNLYSQSNSKITNPEDYFGFKPGADRMLFTYEQLISYLQKIDEQSDKIKLVDIGKSPMGKPMYIAFLSSAENIAKLDELKEINKKLALNADLSINERAQLIKNGKVFVLGTLSMHSGEVGPAQASPLIAYELITSKEEGVLKWLDDAVYMMVPNHNPDGMDMIVENYLKYKGTKYEGSSMPGVYHKYVGHDNNRDFITLSQSDNAAIAAIYNLTWYPQVLVEKHQMGSTGIRYFVAPPHDPIAENIDAGIWNWVGLFGSNLIKDMTKDGLKGVGQHTIFDMYWPGSTETALWKNVIGLLTEGASAKTATPIFIEPNELSVGGKGLSEYKKSINMPEPWPGGWWRLGDLVDYEISSTKSILRTASTYRKEILEFRNDMAITEVNKGKTEAPYYYILPQKQHDYSELVNLAHLLNEHGVNVYKLKKNMTIEGTNYIAGDLVVPLAQPFRAFIKEVLEAQEFPLRHYTPGGEIIEPYDITSWSLPLHRGVQSNEINSFIDLMDKIELLAEEHARLKVEVKDFKALLFSANSNESYKMAFTALNNNAKIERLEENYVFEGITYPKGSFLIHSNSIKDDTYVKLYNRLNVKPALLDEIPNVKARILKNPRVALIETYMHDMDAGWTRYVFDTYKVNYSVLKPHELDKAKLSENFDVIVFPNNNKSILMTGKYASVGGSYSPSSYPPEYAKGMEKDGLNQLMKFVDAGGIIVSWEASIELFNGTLSIDKGKEGKEDFRLPFREIGADLKNAGLYCPGSLVKVNLLQDHPLTYGMPSELGVFFRGYPVFQTSVPSFDTDRRVIGTFPEKGIFMSGYIEKEELLANKSALIWLGKGKGQFVLFGFNPQFRASTQGAFKLLFNSLLLPKL
ncbi:MAG: hypothetical protein KKG99_02620 [Bacteroidetes bacterium]|nr:hypothetical protein [Bacteroidota bacterium]